VAHGRPLPAVGPKNHPLSRPAGLLEPETTGVSDVCTKRLGSAWERVEYPIMKASRKSPTVRSRSAIRSKSKTRSGRIHPVITFPFRHPANLEHLEQLYSLVKRLDADKTTYARPSTIIDCKTRSAMRSSAPHTRFLARTVARHSDIIEAWCVDTCQMWYTALGKAYEQGKPNDVYWLIPGDFNYGGSIGRDVLSRLHDLPEICDELNQDLCIGEIAADHNNSKQLIDTYGTFALLYNWFPSEAQEIRTYTERPRSEFFAVRHEFLGRMLHQRWYAYEQTVVMLLHAVQDQRRISRFFVGNISDLPEGRDTISSAMQQVERTERVLKTLWREQHHEKTGWSKRYRQLEAQSEQVRRTALILLENLLA